MTGSFRGGWRATAVLTGTVAATTLLLTGCGAGQIAQTADRVPTSVGANAQSADNLFKVRNLSIDYLNTTGYPSDGDAPLTVSLYNDSDRPVTVRVAAQGARTVVLANPGSATPSPSVNSPSPTTGTPSPGGSPSGEQSGSPSGGSASPSTPAVPTEAPEAPAQIQIPAASFVVLSRSAGSWLQLNGLSAALPPGASLPLTFDFGGVEVQTQAPVAVPLTPAPVATPVTGGEEHE